jgi:hypothetical protein
VAPENRKRFEGALVGTDFACIGTVTEASEFVVVRNGAKFILRENVAALKETWKTPFGELV